jgi:hypothetical protein
MESNLTPPSASETASSDLLSMSSCITLTNFFLSLRSCC